MYCFSSRCLVISDGAQIRVVDLLLSAYWVVKHCMDIKTKVSEGSVRVYLVNERLSVTGGVETLIVRLANFYVSLGIDVIIFCKSIGDLKSLLDSRVEVIFFVETNDIVELFHEHVTPERERKLLIVSFDPISAARGLMIETSIDKDIHVVHVSGVFHPRAYFFSFERWDRVFFNFLVALAIGKSYLFFMNEECRANHSRRWKTDLSGCPIFPLPIAYTEKSWESSKNNIVRVVSVGRLVDFKAYNLGAAKIVRTCMDRGVNVYWDIYGDGPLYDSIKEAALAHGVADNVCLKGVLNYDEFSSVVSGYDLFIGMGTAALEAAMAGVPTICATDSELANCYGYIQDLPFGNVGELQSLPPKLEITDMIQSYSFAKDVDRIHLSDQGREMAERYGMPKFADELLSLLVINASVPSWLFKRIMAKIYCFLTESDFVKMLRNLRGFLIKK